MHSVRLTFKRVLKEKTDNLFVSVLSELVSPSAFVFKGGELLELSLKSSQFCTIVQKLHLRF